MEEVAGVVVYVVVGEVVDEVVGDVFDEVVGEVVGVVVDDVDEVVGDVVGDVVYVVEEDGGEVPDTAVVFDTPTQAFQFSMPSVQSVVIDAPAISTTVVFWPFIIRQMVTVTCPTSPLKGALPW